MDKLFRVDLDIWIHFCFSKNGYCRCYRLLVLREVRLSFSLFPIFLIFRDRNAIGNPCSQSIYMLFRYHLGSIAFGSLVITAVKLPRYIFMYLYAKMHASKNFVVKYLLACVIGILACVEKCLRYLHHNAYTVNKINVWSRLMYFFR